MTQTNELKTTLGRAWKLKTFLFMFALFALAIWGAYDALLVYPARGRLYAQFALKQYLESAEKPNATPGSSGYWPVRTPAEMSVADPPAELARLKTLMDEGALDVESRLGERTRFEWLQALSRIDSLARIKRENDAELARRAAEPQSAPQPTKTLFVDLYKRYNDLAQSLKSVNQPAKLAFFDIPLQLGFMLTGIVGFILMVVFFIRVRRKVFRYDPVAKKLTLPDGVSFTPADIEVVDKRKWDKFIVFITLKSGAPEMRLDLYRYEPLEAWILEMEKLAPGYEPVVEEGEAILCANVLTGQPLRLIPGADTTLPVRADASAGDAGGGPEAVYPVVRTVAGPWYVVGASLRTRLRDAAESGALDRGALKVDLGSFEVRVADHDPENVPELDLGAGEGEQEPEHEEPASTTAG